MNLIVNIWSLLAMILLSCIATGLIIWMLRKPFSKLSEHAKWSLTTPKVSLMVNRDNAKLLEKLHKHVSTFTFEEKCLLVQEVFGKDVRFTFGLNKQGQWWIDSCLPYPYQEMYPFMGGEE